MFQSKTLQRQANSPFQKCNIFFLQSPPTRGTNQATREVQRMRAFARFKNEICCMDLVFVDKLAKDNNGVKYLLIRQDMFDRMVDAKGVKAKDSEETVKFFSKMITIKNRPKKFV